jgi:hypothetical protein
MIWNKSKAYKNVVLKKWFKYQKVA